MKWFLRALLPAGLTLMLAVPPAALAQPGLKPCRVAGIKTEVQCGVIERALDPAQAAGTKIDIHYVVVPALARRKLPDPVFLLAGGPGQSAISVAPMMVQMMSRLNNRRDLVFVDQRGTGQSAPLLCAEDRGATLAQQIDTERRQVRLRQCLAELQKLPYGDLRFFTTTLAMQDLDAVRQALAAPRINLVGVSYGTRAALEYMRQFGPTVRRSVLDGVAPPDMALPQSASGDNQAALQALLVSCEADAGCTRSYPTLRADWLALLASLPREVPVADPLSGEVQRVLLTRQSLLDGVRGPLYAPALAAALPYALQQAAQGRFEALLGLGTMLEQRGPRRMAEGMHFSVLCAEDLPRMNAETPGGADFGQAFSQQYLRTCGYWPRGAVPAAFYTVPPTAAPALLLSGGVDPVTPPRHGARVAKALGASARHVVVPNAGHGVLSLGCMHELLFRFVDAPEDAAALALDTGCASAIPRPPAFVPVHAVQQGRP
ncbi:MAG: alpha/beta hydrolase [Rhodoferax sp.]